MPKRFQKFLLQLHSWLSRSYPAGFREDFGSEIRLTFRDALSEASEKGWQAMLRVFWRELQDLPGAVLREHWHAYQASQKEWKMSESAFSSDPAVKTDPSSLNHANRPQTWRNSLLAGLPHLSLAVVMLVSALVTRTQTGMELERSVAVLTMIFAWSVSAGLLIFFFIAWKQGFPVWSASYYFYLFLLGAGFLLVSLQTSQIYPYLIVILLLALVVLLLLVIRQDALQGLLMAVPIVICAWFPVLEFIPNFIRNPLQIGMFLVAALAAVAIARSGSWRFGTWTILFGSFLTGLPIAYFRTFHNNIPPEHADPATVGMLAERFSQALFWSAALVIAPLLVWVYWELSRRLNRSSRTAFRILLSGLLLNYFASLASSHTFAAVSRFRISTKWTDLLLSTLILLGALLFGSGVWKLLSHAWKIRLITDRLTLVFLAAPAAAFPLIFLFPLFENRKISPTLLPVGLFEAHQIPPVLVYGLGGLWLLLTAWIVTRLKIPAPSGPEDQAARLLA